MGSTASAPLRPVRSVSPIPREYFQFNTDPQSLPQKVDLRQSTCFPYLPPRDQGVEGSCVSHAMGGAIECAQRRHRVALDRSVEPEIDKHFAYAMASASDPHRRIEDGITFSEAIRAYEGSGINCYWLVPDTINMKQAIHSGYPFVFGFAVTSKMREWQESQELQRSTRFMLPEYIPNVDVIDGYHSALAVGYDDARKSFLVRNSWGEAWGDLGHFWMTYTTASHPDITQDVMIVDLKKK